MVCICNVVLFRGINTLMLFSDCISLVPLLVQLFLWLCTWMKLIKMVGRLLFQQYFVVSLRMWPLSLMVGLLRLCLITTEKLLLSLPYFQELLYVAVWHHRKKHRSFLATLCVLLNALLLEIVVHFSPTTAFLFLAAEGLCSFYT